MDARRYTGSMTVMPTEGHSAPAAVNSASWQDLLDAFVAALQQKEATRRSYRKALVPFFKWLDSTGRDFRLVSRADILAFRDHLQDPADARQPRTVSLYLTALRQLYAWIAAETGRPDPTAGIKGARIRSSRLRFERQALTTEQAARLLSWYRDYHPRRAGEAGKGAGGRHAAFRDSAVIALRNYAIVSTMLRCGLRTVEVSRLRVRNIALRDGFRVLYVWGKGHEAPGRNSQPDDFVRLTDKAYEPIGAYLRARGKAAPDAPLFAGLGHGSEGTQLSTRTISSICKAGLRAIGIDDPAYSAHSLRHTTGETLAEQGVPLLEIQGALRHQNPATTEIYIHQAMAKMKLERPAAAVLDAFFDDDEQ